MQESCIFCKISKGEIPSSCIYEDDDFMVILDKFPSVLGHTLIIPKEHTENIFDLSTEKAEKIFLLAQKIAKSMKKSLNSDGINILQNNGEAAGQSVHHFHMHVIPRFKNDNIIFKWETREVNDDLINQTRGLIMSNL